MAEKKSSKSGNAPFTDDEFDNSDEVFDAGDANENVSGSEHSDVDVEANSADSELIQKLAEQKAKAEENWNQLLRVKAEMDNLRKRHTRELEQAHKFAVEKFVTDMIPVKDSIEMGIDAAADKAADTSQIIEGMQLTLRMFEQVFGRFGIEMVNPVDEKFDPEKHEAMSMQPSVDKPAGMVLNVIQKGYTLKGRTVRPAMVVVSKGAPDSDASVDTTA